LEKKHDKENESNRQWAEYWATATFLEFTFQFSKFYQYQDKRKKIDKELFFL